MKLNINEKIPKVYILILNWNGWKDTLSCLESIFNCTYSNFQILIIDNASTDDSLQLIEKWFKDQKQLYLKIIDEVQALKQEESIPIQESYNKQRITIIQNNHNYGYAGGNNIGIKYVLKRNDASYIWLLNNDTTIDAAALTSLVNLAESNPEIGVVGSKLLYLNRPDIIQTLGGGQFNPVFGMVCQIGNGLLKNDASKFNKIRFDYITGASFFIKVNTIEEVGMLQEDYFMYSEDIDWSLRIKRAGWELVYCPDSVIWHKEGASAGYQSPMTDYYSSRNNLYIVKRFFAFYLPVAVMISFWGKMFNRIVRGQPRNIICILRAYRDFFCGKQGELN